MPCVHLRDSVSGTSELVWKGHLTQLLRSHIFGYKGGCVWSPWWRSWSDQDFSFNVLHCTFYWKALKFCTVFKALAPRKPLGQQEMELLLTQELWVPPFQKVGWLLWKHEDSRDVEYEGNEDVRGSFISLSEEYKLANKDNSGELSHLFYKASWRMVGQFCFKTLFLCEEPCLFSAKLVFPWIFNI